MTVAGRVRWVGFCHAYRDDIVLLARTRWQLRRTIAALHEEIAALGLHLHRIKRLIGRTTQGNALRSCFAASPQARQVRSQAVAVLLRVRARESSLRLWVRIRLGIGRGPLIDQP